MDAPQAARLLPQTLADRKGVVNFQLTTKSKTIAIAVVVVLVLGAASLLLHRECDFGGGMPGWYRECSCMGIERPDYDQTAADGPRRTICIGLVTSRTCYQYPDEPTVACESLPQ